MIYDYSDKALNAFDNVVYLTTVNYFTLANQNDGKICLSVLPEDIDAPLFRYFWECAKITEQIYGFTIKLPNYWSFWTMIKFNLSRKNRPFYQKWRRHKWYHRAKKSENTNLVNIYDLAEKEKCFFKDEISSYSFEHIYDAYWRKEK